MTKQTLIKTLMLLVVALSPVAEAIAQTTRYQVGVCDWMILKRQKLGAFALAKEIGADGIEVDMGSLGQRVMFDNELRGGEKTEAFIRAKAVNKIAIPSIAMSGFFAQSFLKRDNYKDLLDDCFDTMERMGARVAFLPLGGSGKEWMVQGSPERADMTRRLHDVGETALSRGVVVGIRTQMNAKESIRLLREIDSEGIKIYYNFQDAADNGWDICKELKRLGKKRICQIHASNTDKVNLREDTMIDLPKIRKTLDKIGWKGWLVVERSRDVTRVKDVKYNFSRNVAYLKEIFEE